MLMFGSQQRARAILGTQLPIRLHLGYTSVTRRLHVRLTSPVARDGCCRHKEGHKEDLLASSPRLSTAGTPRGQLGLFGLLDEETALPHGSDLAFLEKARHAAATCAPCRGPLPM